MYKLEQLTSDPLQELSITLDDGSTFVLTVYFMSNQYCWTIQKLTYGSFEINNLFIANNPNLLFQWKNILPFGIGCFSESKREPSLIDDFSSDSSSLYVLNKTEVDFYSEILSE